MTNTIIDDILKSLEVEVKHFSEIFTSTMGVTNSEWYYRITNEDKIRAELIKNNLSYEEVDELIQKEAKKRS